MSGVSPSGNYAAGPLPERLTVAGWRVSLILVSFSIALPSFLNGAQTGLAVGFWPAVAVALIANAILGLGGILTAMISVRTRLNTYLLIQRSFGLTGAGLVNIVIAVVHFCWFGINVSFFGGAMLAVAGIDRGATDAFAGIDAFAGFVILGSLLMTVSTIYGFRMLDRLALVTVPLLAAILVAVCVAALRRHGVVLAPSATPPAPMSFGIAISALIGSNMLTIATMPDLSRFIRARRGAALSMVLAFPVAGPLLMVVSALPALATGDTDIMAMIVSFGFGVPVLLILVMSMWTINSANLYSASLSLTATFPRVPQWLFTVAGGAIGTVFALMGILDAFVPFLLFLGLIIPPIAAIYVIDGFVTFARADPADTLSAIPPLRWEAVGTWLGSILVALLAAYRGLTVTTIPALDATIFAALLYAVVLRLRRPRTGAARPSTQA